MITNLTINILVLFCILIYTILVEIKWHKRLMMIRKMMEELKEEKAIQGQGINKADASLPFDENWQNDSADEPLRFVIEIPKSERNGEDAPPLLMDLNTQDESTTETTCVILGVFDGMGGAGAVKLTLTDGSQKTNAFVASRTARQLVEQYFATQTYIGNDIEQQLKIWIQNGLKEKYSEMEANAPQSRLNGTGLFKVLPTTMALLWYQHLMDKNTVQLSTLWAGDSRCYAISTQKGLLQLTKDDNGVDDALLALMQAPPMNNTISASHDFKINRKDYEMDAPCMLFTASDGVFDYFPSPILLEYNIINTLQQSSSIKEWSNRLQVILDAWKQDDVSLVLTLPGFKNFNEAKKAFSQRLEWLKSNYLDMIEEADRCTRILQEKKILNLQIDEYNAKKKDINTSIKAIEAELEMLSKKKEEIQRLIDDYKRQIEYLETQIKSEEEAKKGYNEKYGVKKTEKDSKETEKAPWDEKIAEMEQKRFIIEQKQIELICSLRKESVKTWEAYKSSYEEMITRQQADEKLSLENNNEPRVEQQNANI